MEGMAGAAATLGVWGAGADREGLTVGEGTGAGCGLAITRGEGDVARVGAGITVERGGDVEEAAGVLAGAASEGTTLGCGELLLEGDAKGD